MRKLIVSEFVTDDGGTLVIECAPDGPACALAAGRRMTNRVVLSGGVFQNRRLLGQTTSLLEDAGLRVLTPERLPPNDGGIAYGQLAVAAARLAGEDGGVDVRT